MMRRRTSRFVAFTSWIACWLVAMLDARAQTSARPTITRDPVAQSVTVGDSVTFSVGATGPGVLRYAWFRDTIIVFGSQGPRTDGASFTIENVKAADAGVYTAWVINDAGTTISRGARLTVAPRPIAGTYFGRMNFLANTFALHVRADGTGVFLAFVRAGAGAGVYLGRDVRVGADRRFQFTATVIAGPLAGATAEVRGSIDPDGELFGSIGDDALFAPAPDASGATSALAGFYASTARPISAVPGPNERDSNVSYAIVGPKGRAYVVFAGRTLAEGGPIPIDANGVLSGTTDNNLSVVGALDAASGVLTSSLSQATFPTLHFVGASTTRPAVEALVNLSTRTTLTAAQPSFAVGFVVSGIRPKAVLVRGIGPALGAFGVSGALPAPRLEVFRGSTSIATATEWGLSPNAAAIPAVAAQVGAFALAPGSRDAALLLTLEAGSYSAVLSGRDGALGAALVEVYDATPGAVTRGEHLVNVSTLGAAGTGDDVLTAGFSIRGAVPKRVLVRAAGPGLVQFNVPSAAARLGLRVFAGDTRIAENNGWSTSTEAGLTALAARDAGAFPFVSGSSDCAMVLSLAPGSYTAQVASLGPAPGAALVEVYELP